MRAIVCLFKATSEAKRRVLPPELESVEFPFDAIFIAEYPDSTIGPYNENLILLYTKYGKMQGLYVMNIYVDDDAALTAGREIWGYPKKLCNIKLSPIKNNKITGTLVRKGKTILHVEAELTEKAPGVDPSYFLKAFPLINLKLIPDVADNSRPALSQLTETHIAWHNIRVAKGLKVKSITSEYSPYDVCSEVINVSDTSIGGFYVECDQTLPNGRVLKNLV
jgi:acetoacetate decarboxylase